MDGLPWHLQQERRRCIIADGARKRASAAPPVDEDTSSGTWTLSPSTRSPVEVAVNEDGFEIYDPAAFDSSLTREDFVPDEVLDTVTGAVEARSVEEVQADAKRRRREVDIDQLLLDQGLDQDRRHREQEASSSKGKGVVIFVDDDSSDEE